MQFIPSARSGRVVAACLSTFVAGSSTPANPQLRPGGVPPTPILLAAADVPELPTLSAPAVGTPPQTPAPPPAASPPPPPMPVPFDEAVLRAANDLFSKASLPERAVDRVLLAIDPLVDGVTGAQSFATRSMEQRIVQLVRDKYPRFEVQPFSVSTIARFPVVLIGTFTPVNNAGQANGPRDAYRVCLALADLKERKVISKGVARSQMDGVDATPTAFFEDSPVWTKDPAIDGYVKTCQGTRPGDPIDQVYADRILAAAFVSDAIDAYDQKRYGDALELYKVASRTPGGDQLRAYNGIYLANWKLGKRRDGAEAFSKLIDYGLGTNRLAIKILFRSGSTNFLSDKQSAAPYSMWLDRIARAADRKASCLELVGHTSPTGPAPLNERLSVLRAEAIRTRLKARVPALGTRMIATGVGARENLVGTGRENASDALDRRVEFKVVAGC